MYRQLRLRLTLWYVFLSTITFVALGLAGTFFCYESVTSTLDISIEHLIAQALHLVDESNPIAVRLKPPSEKLSTEWSRLKATVQLYDPTGKLIAQYGPPGYTELRQSHFFEIDFNNRHLRMTSDPIRYEGTTVGHLQVEVPTESRDNAVFSFALTLAFLTPVLIIILAVSGYWFSGKASKPVEEAISLLRQFMADAGHELKTPIHLIQLTAENAAIGHEDDAELQQDLNTIVRATDRMGRLVEDMMMLAKMEVRQLNIKSLPVRLDELLHNAVDEYVRPAREKGIHLETPQLEPTTVIGDPDSLYRAVSNLIENALRYTDSGGKVSVDLKSTASNVRIRVEDTGIGIPQESLPLIFNRFYRVDKSRARAAGGSGLGLAIVQAICEAHRGRVDVESEEGRGSAFTLSLPNAPKNTGAHRAVGPQKK